MSATLSGFVTLGQIGDRLALLEVSRNCGVLQGRLRVGRLKAEHGQGPPTLELA